jgi:hypothetical protein
VFGVQGVPDGELSWMNSDVPVGVTPMMATALLIG